MLGIRVTESATTDREKTYPGCARQTTGSLFFDAQYGLQSDAASKQRKAAEKPANGGDTRLIMAVCKADTICTRTERLNGTSAEDVAKVPTKMAPNVFAPGTILSASRLHKEERPDAAVLCVVQKSSDLLKQQEGRRGVKLAWRPPTDRKQRYSTLFREILLQEPISKPGAALKAVAQAREMGTKESLLAGDTLDEVEDVISEALSQALREKLSVIDSLGAKRRCQERDNLQEIIERCRETTTDCFQDQLLLEAGGGVKNVSTRNRKNRLAEVGVWAPGTELRMEAESTLALLDLDLLHKAYQERLATREEFVWRKIEEVLGTPSDGPAGKRPSTTSSKLSSKKSSEQGSAGQGDGGEEAAVEGEDGAVDGAAPDGGSEGEGAAEGEEGAGGEEGENEAGGSGGEGLEGAAAEAGAEEEQSSSAAPSASPTEYLCVDSADVAALVGAMRVAYKYSQSLLAVQINQRVFEIARMWSTTSRRSEYRAESGLQNALEGSSLRSAAMELKRFFQDEEDYREECCLQLDQLGFTVLAAHALDKHALDPVHSPNLCSHAATALSQINRAQLVQTLERIDPAQVALYRNLFYHGIKALKTAAMEDAAVAEELRGLDCRELVQTIVEMNPHLGAQVDNVMESELLMFREALEKRDADLFRARVKAFHQGNIDFLTSYGPQQLSRKDSSNLYLTGELVSPDARKELGNRFKETRRYDGACAVKMPELPNLLQELGDRRDFTLAAEEEEEYKEYTGLVVK
ncbi:unnamed protein product [Amoebophrya sp. A25]|nr:unnamed protein product [Amoebophrya sp. A25]|eukprot:GSA25T00019498001.1